MLVYVCVLFLISRFQSISGPIVSIVMIPITVEIIMEMMIMVLCKIVLLIVLCMCRLRRFFSKERSGIVPNHIWY